MHPSIPPSIHPSGIFVCRAYNISRYTDTQIDATWWHDLAWHGVTASLRPRHWTPRTQRIRTATVADPQWSWRSVHVRWYVNVAKDQSMRWTMGCARKTTADGFRISMQKLFTESADATLRLPKNGILVIPGSCVAEVDFAKNIFPPISS